MELDGQIKIVAAVKFNSGVAYVLNRQPELEYYKKGNLMYGVDETETFFSCYSYDPPSGKFYAFGGRKFEIKLHDGTVEECYGQWWHGGMQLLAKNKKIEISDLTISTQKELKNCYVFSGMSCNPAKFNLLVKEYKGCVYPYYDYEKVLLFDDRRTRHFWKERALEKRIKSLINEVKKKHQTIKDLTK